MQRLAVFLAVALLVAGCIKFARGFQFGPIKIGDLDKHESTPLDWDGILARIKAQRSENALTASRPS